MLKISSFILAVLSIAASQAGPRFDLIPLSGIRVNTLSMGYKTIKVESSDGGIIVNNEIPINQEFKVAVEKPSGFLDSAGLIRVGYEYQLVTAEGGKIASDADIFKSMAPMDGSMLSNLSFTLTIDGKIKPNTVLTLMGRIFDKKSSSYISWQYTFKVVPASKRLPKGLYTYWNSDTRGMKASSVQLHFNFFEFKGLEGNKFLYQIKKDDDVHLILRGLEGWKIAGGKAAPRAEMVILSDDGKELESTSDILKKSKSEYIKSTKKELEFKYKPKSILEAGKYYLVWLKLRDNNSPKGVLDVVVKFYVQE
jgi:hypothetical protein